MKNKTESKLISAIFVAFIFAMGILYAVMPKKEFSETEKRYLADFPKLSIESLCNGDFASGFEKFLADQTPMRKFFVTVNSYYELARGNNGSDGIYLGSDGWLIEKPFKRINKFNVNIKRINDFAQKCGVNSAIMAVPSKGYIYSGNLPKNSLEYHDGEYMKKLTGYCGKNMTVINIFDAMNRAKDGEQLFYKTDHHWTSKGAYVAYVEACNAFGTVPAAKDEFDIETTGGFYGTSYSTSLYTLTKPDSVEIFRSKKSGGKADVTVFDGDEKHFDNMFFAERLKESDKYVAFLDGNHPLVKIETGNPGGRLLIIKDSFANCLVPFLAENFSEIVMLDLRYYRKPVSEVITENGITQLLFVYSMENLAESEDIILK